MPLALRAICLKISFKKQFALKISPITPRRLWPGCSTKGVGLCSFRRVV